MRRFARLIQELRDFTHPHDRIATLVRYFETTPPADAAWAVWLLLGPRWPASVPAETLRRWAIAWSGIPDWLVARCEQETGSLAEALARLPVERCAGAASTVADQLELLFSQAEPPAQAMQSMHAKHALHVGREKQARQPVQDSRPDPVEALAAGAGEGGSGGAGGGDDWPLHRLAEGVLARLGRSPKGAQEQARLLGEAWMGLDAEARVVLNRLVLGRFRSVVTHEMVSRALAAGSGVDAATLCNRLAAPLQPTPEAWAALMQPADGAGTAADPGAVAFAAPVAPADPARPWVARLVLVMVKEGRGCWSGLLSDFTLAAVAPDGLAPIARVEAGLTEDEVRQVDAWAREHTERWVGPVRFVAPELVFEVAYAGVDQLRRPNPGVGLAASRLLRWRRDLHPDQATPLEEIQGEKPLNWKSRLWILKAPARSGAGARGSTSAGGSPRAERP